MLKHSLLNYLCDCRQANNAPILSPLGIIYTKNLLGGQHHTPKAITISQQFPFLEHRILLLKSVCLLVLKIVITCTLNLLLTLRQRREMRIFLRK